MSLINEKRDASEYNDASAQEPPFKKIKVESVTTIEQPKGIQETDVGITEYISDSKAGFFGTLKQRYTDFLVNEIDKNGNVVHLIDEGVVNKKERRREKREKARECKTEGEEGSAIDSTNIAESPESAENKDVIATPVANTKAAKYELVSENRKKLLEYITVEELAQIEELFSTGNNMETTSKFPNKKSRGELHQLVREAFQNKLETITTEENTFRIALAKKNPNRRANPNRDENGVINYGLGPMKNYLHFACYKENKETMEVASTFAKFLRIPSKNIRYAGTKDRRGVTVQKMAIHKMRVDRVNNLNKTLRGIKLGSFTYEDGVLNLGDLNGNEFVITIRDVATLNENQSLESVIKTCFDSLQEKGFINYFGMQRFGTFSVSTHQIGVKLLQENWTGAAQMILSEQEIVTPDSVEAREIWAATLNPSMALKKMPRKCTAEYSILQQLAREKLNEEEIYSDHSYFQSIMQIPRNLRIMYAHAYQSYVWNCVASKRIELFGLQVVEGDLVIDESKEESTVVDENGEEFEEDLKKDIFIRAKALTKEDIESGKYSIYDVVLPTPGFDILYPKNEKLVQVYHEVMKKDNLDPLNMARKVREFSLAGSYRNVMSKPLNVSYYIKKYDDLNQQLIRTDLEIMKLKDEAKAAGKEDQEISQVIEGNTEGKQTAVILKMQLGVSAYATMALRELMKTDTARRSENFNVAQGKK